MIADPKPRSAKVVIVEDHHMFREWLGRSISEQGTVAVVGGADNIQDAFSLIEQKRPDLVLLDITLNGSSGLELVKNLRAFGLKIPVLVLSMHDESLYAERALRAGANGYITKHAASETLMEAIECVLGGKVYLSESATASILTKVATQPQRKRTGIAALADRELEVFRLIGHGRTTAEIATELGLGESTVETYRARIKEKLGIRNFVELQTRSAQWVQGAERIEPLDM
jgi:DNA-binding NarL/FixJ family response regulator